MVYPKIVLDERRIKKNGTYPLVIRVSHNRQTATFPIGVSVKREHWDEENSNLKKTHPQHRKLSSDISGMYYRIHKVCIDLIDGNQFSVNNLKRALTVQPKTAPVKLISFNEYADQLICELYRNNRVGNALIYQTALNRIRNFSNGSLICFEEINYKFLQNFKQVLISDGLSANTISNYFRTIRAIFNKAIKEKLVTRDLYPFLEISFKQERTMKKSLSKIQLVTINTIETVSSGEYHARNYFMLSFYLIGISFTDLAYLRKDCNKGGRLEYRRRKTGKIYSIKLPDEAIEIFNNYKSERKYLIPVLPDHIIEDSLKANQLIHQWIKTTNKYLKRIGNRLEVGVLTTYVARHTWATLVKRMGYSNELIAEALGHEYGNRTTAIYLDSFEAEVIDNVNESLIKSLISAPDESANRKKHSINTSV